MSYSCPTVRPREGVPTFFVQLSSMGMRLDDVHGSSDTPRAIDGTEGTAGLGRVQGEGLTLQ
jgi:hypothetical protein